MNKKGVTMEEWKVRRKERKKKEEEKREKGKSGFGKSPFCFCLTVSLPLLFFFPAPTTPHQNTRSHSPTTHHTTWRNVAHHHMQTGPCAVLPFWEWTARHTLHHPHTSLHLLTPHNTPTNSTQIQLMVHATIRWQLSMRMGIGQKAKVGQHSSTNTLI